MRTLFLLFVALGTLASAQTKFENHTMGETVRQFAEIEHGKPKVECVRDHSADDPSHNVCHLLYRKDIGHESFITYLFTDGKLADISMKVTPAAFADALAMLEKNFGVPTLIETEPWENPSGKKIYMLHEKWNDTADLGQIPLHGAESSGVMTLVDVK